MTLYRILTRNQSLFAWAAAGLALAQWSGGDPGLPVPAPGPKFKVSGAALRQFTYPSDLMGVEWTLSDKLHADPAMNLRVQAVLRRAVTDYSAALAPRLPAPAPGTTSLALPRLEVAVQNGLEAAFDRDLIESLSSREDAIRFKALLSPFLRLQTAAFGSLEITIGVERDQHGEVTELNVAAEELNSTSFAAENFLLSSGILKDWLQPEKR
jgi:hypothetical protein